MAMELLEGGLVRVAEDGEIRSKVKEPQTETAAEPAASPRLPRPPPPPLPPPEFYIPEQLLPRALSALQGEDLGKFKRKLCDFSGFLRISQAQVEAADVAEFRDLLLCNYGWLDSLEKAGRALTNIGRKREGKWLNFAIQGFWMPSCMEYALGCLDSEGLEDLRNRYLMPVEPPGDLPQFCSLMLTKLGWFGALGVSVEVLEAKGLSDEADWLTVAEMNKGPQNFLQYALDTLEKEDLEKFKSCLNNLWDQEESGSVFKGLLKGERNAEEPVDASKFSWWLISCYGEVGALKVAADGLEAINQKRQAGWLRLCLEACDPWKYLEDTLVGLKKEELQKLKRYLFPPRFSLPVPQRMVEAADVSELCSLLRKFCGDFVVLDVAGEILEAIGQKHGADQLRFAMMGFSPWRCLNYVLQRLGQEDLGRFKRKLDVRHMERAPDLVLMLEQSDTRELSRHLINLYGEDDALEVAAKVLDSINMQHQASWLRMEVMECGAWKSLNSVLLSLEEDDLERFRCNLLLPDSKGFPPVPKAWLEGTTVLQHTKVMFSFYGCAALEVARQVLELLGCRSLGDRLSSLTRKVLDQNLVQISDSAEPQLESPDSSGKETIVKMDSADRRGNCVCHMSLSENLSVKIEPELFRDSKRHCNVYNVQDHEEMNRKIDKPPSTLRPLKIGNLFFVPALNDIVVYPKELEFHYMQADMMQHYFELYDEKKQSRLELRLLEKKKDELVWEACVRQDDLNYDASLAEQGNAKRGGPSNPITLGRSRKQETSPLKQHFIHRHEVVLIQRTANVNGILDILRQREILGSEDYQKIFSIKNDIDKMRKLYSLMRSWNDYCKDQFYEALKTKDKFLIEDLEGK